MRILLPPACALVLALAAGPAASFTGHDETASLELPLAYDVYQAAAATRPFEPAGPGRGAGLGTTWRVQTDPQSGYVRMALGGGLSLASAVRSEAQAEALAHDFILARTGDLGVRVGNAELQSVRQAAGTWAVHYQQVLLGVPVWKGTAFVVLGDNGNVAAFGSDFRPEPEDVPAHPLLSDADALSAAARSIGAVPRTDKPQIVERYWVPAPADEVFELATAYRVVFEANEPFGMWETFVHGITGEILGRRNMYFPVDVIGNTQGATAANPPSYGWCSGFSTYPYEHMTVSVSGGNSATSDETGAFVIPHGGTTPVNVTAQFLGPYSNINRHSSVGGADANQTVSATPGTPFTLSWTAANSRDDERTTFYHANLVHDFMKGLDPTFTQLDYAMPSVIGRNDLYCPGNAWWDGTGMNYCREGTSGSTTYYNTGTLGNVIYHEYGHGVTQHVYSRRGAPAPPSGLHEGNSDVIANFLDRNSHIGLGFSSSTGCSNGIRNAVNGLTYPAYTETGGHTAGQVIAGFHWLAWQSMLGAMPQAVADSVAFRTWHRGRDLGTPQTFPAQVQWTFIADDNDANLGNGTPNYDHLCPAAQAKGFVCPEIISGVFIVHQQLPHSVDGSAGFDVAAVITSTLAAIDASQVKTFYRQNGGAFVELLMTATGNPDEYSAHLPAMPQNTEVEYYISAADMLGNSRTSPSTAPAALHAFDVAWAYDDLEGGVAGWTAGLPGDDATTGHWGLFDPVGTAAQPEDDATPDPGVLCFITGQCASGHGSCTTTCTLGCNDVDGGTTRLLSPVYDLTGAVTAKVKYARWYSNDTGSTPGTDFWVVDVSNDGGTTWTNVENTNVSAASWTNVSVDINALFGTPGRVRIRFVASDLGSGSLVEAGVDEVRVLADFGGVVDAPEVVPAAAPARLALEPAQPNPFRATTRIDFAVPNAGDVKLAVYDVSGRAVRTLVSGTREAGRYRADWDGRGGDGQRVAAGVYFFRLTAGGESLTRKITMMN